jgi:ribosomal protein L37AE/L43A
MEHNVWLLLALVVALVALGAVLAGLRRRSPSMDHSPARCTSCETPMSLRRVSILESLTLRGVWKCPHCGTRMNKRGRVAGAATGCCA